jgi:hypothetical protein
VPDLRVGQSEASDAPLSSAMMSALGSMPITLTHGPGVPNGCLPIGAPRGGTVKSLRDRGLIERSGNQWVRTALGEAVWSHR